MSEFRTLDLKAFLNHRLIYDSLPDTPDFGLDRICLLKENMFDCREEIVRNGVPFRFCTDENFDNIQCDGERIETDFPATCLHLVGFAYWGDTYAQIRVRYDDGRAQTVKMGIADWSHTRLFGCSYVGLGDERGGEIAAVVTTSGKEKIPIHFHQIRCPLDGRVRSIDLPENMFLHIFAMTLEGPGREEE